MRFAEAAALIDGDALSFTETRSEDYGGFKRTMGEAALAQQDLGGVQFAEVAVDVETGSSGSSGLLRRRTAAGR